MRPPPAAASAATLLQPSCLPRTLPLAARSRQRGKVAPKRCTAGVAPAALTAAKCWAVGAPVGLAVRTLTKGYLPPTAFIVVSLASTAVFLVGWRTALAALTKPVRARAPLSLPICVAGRR